MDKQHIHALHAGELFVQERRGTPSELADQVPHYIDSDMPSQHVEFHSGLSYFPLVTLDQQQRPWVSLLVTKSNDDPSVGIRAFEKSQLAIAAHTNPFDPLFPIFEQEKIASETRYFASVGIDFANRRRNKLAGKIISASNRLEDSIGRIDLTLSSEEHMGNCPKYITVRELEPHNRTAELGFSESDSLKTPLPDECKAHIDQVSTVFLGTRYLPSDKQAADKQPRKKLGLNHRGGAPGFVRIYEETHKEEDRESTDDTVTTYLVLPDYSGNRIYQSLGNIQSDDYVGLVFPNFHNGDMLHITGHAENLFDEEASALMPRTSMVTRIRITGAMFIKSGLNLKMRSNEQFSPYNPPIRYLDQELKARGYPSESSSNSTATAELVATRTLTEDISTFRFKLSNAMDAPFPGGFGVFDFSEVLGSGYLHMNEHNPQAVNEDYVRTWTLSNASDIDLENRRFKPMDHVEITVKRKPGGLVSNFLHDNIAPLKVTLKGMGAGFSCFQKDEMENRLTIPPKMLWIAGGVGITPFMSMWEGILKMSESLAKIDETGEIDERGKAGETLTTDIRLLFACGTGDLDVLRHFLSNAKPVPLSINIHIEAFLSTKGDPVDAQRASESLTNEYPNSLLSIKQARLERSAFEEIEGLSQTEVFLCGPNSLMHRSRDHLKALCGEELTIHQESYVF